MMTWLKRRLRAKRDKGLRRSRQAWLESYDLSCLSVNDSQFY